MKKSFLIILILNFMVAEVCASAESTTEMSFVRKNENDFRRMKHALLMENMPLVDQIQEENPGIWSYADPKTGQMLIHEVFTRSYPLKSIEHVIHSTNDVNMNVKDILGNRPLHYFIKNGDSYSNEEAGEIFEVLKHNDVQPLSKNNDDVTPLHLAAQLKNDNFLAKLIFMLPKDYQEKGYLDWKDKSGKTPAMYAYEMDLNNNKVLLQDNKALIGKDVIENIYNFYDEQCQKEIKLKNISDSKEQDHIKKKYVDERNEDIALMLIFSQKTDVDIDLIFRQMIQSGFDINSSCSRTGNTLLHWATNKYSPARRQDQPIEIRSLKNNDEKVKILLSLGANSEIKNKDNRKPDYYGDYKTFVDYYQNLQNSVEMHENRKTLFGESIMNAYERWLDTDDATLLTKFLCSRENQVAQLIQAKARSFFQPAFADSICTF